MNHRMFLVVDDQARAIRQCICNNTQEKRTEEKKQTYSPHVSEREEKKKKRGLSTRENNGILNFLTSMI